MNSKKIKTILIYKYLYKYSDAQNPISSSRLIELLGEDGVECERKSIYSDIKALNECGVKVVSTRTPRRGFYLDSREFRVPEVRLLIDAVNSAPFITPQMTRALADKLKGLLSQKQANIIDTLDKAINSRRLVRLKYRTRKIDKENKKSFTTKLFTLSPYALIWKNDKYYLVCNKSSHDNLMNLRLDRIRDIMILDSPARPVGECSEYKNFDAADYSAKMFNMFTGSVETVTLKCDLDLREQILDRFGPSVPLTATDVDHFKTDVQVAVSDGFVSWIMQFGDMIEVLSPASLAELVRDKAQKIAAVYSE